MTDPALLPDFYIIGAAKSGTTTLYDVLKQHPAVEMSTVKEPRFFSNDAKYARGIDWYVQTYYQAERLAAVRGEASPQYLYWSEKSAPRIQETYAGVKVKFVAIFREPVQRAYSQYWHAYRAGWDDWSFEDAVRHEEERLREFYGAGTGGDEIRFAYLKVGSYAAQLRPFLERFPRESFLFLLQDDLSRDFPGTIRQLLTFLEINSDAPIAPVVSNPASLPRSRALLKWLKSPARTGSLKGFLKRLAPSPLRKKVKQEIRKANQKVTRYPPMDQALKVELKQRYVEEIKELETLIDRDLSHWLAA